MRSVLAKRLRRRLAPRCRWKPALRDQQQQWPGRRILNPLVLVLPAGMIVGGYPLLMFYNTLPNILVYGTGKLRVQDFPIVGTLACAVAFTRFALPRSGDGWDCSELDSCHALGKCGAGVYKSTSSTLLRLRKRRCLWRQ